MIKRLARWVLRNEDRLLPKIGESLWTGYVHLVVEAQVYQQAINGDHEVTLRLVRREPHHPGQL